MHFNDFQQKKEKIKNKNEAGKEEYLVFLTT